MCLLEMEYIYALERWQFLKDAEEKKRTELKRRCVIVEFFIGYATFSARNFSSDNYLNICYIPAKIPSG